MWAVSVRSREIVETSEPGKPDGSELMVTEDSRTAPPTTEIEGHPLPLRDANATWTLCSWETLCIHVCLSLCNHVCLYVYVYVFVSVYV